MPSRPDQQHLETSPIHLLHRAGQRVTEVFQDELGHMDLTPRQLAILAAVADNDQASQTRLVEVTGIDRSTLADVVRRMLKKRLLQRKRTKEDARAYAVTLTEQGRNVLKQATPVSERVDNRLLEALPANRRETFMRDLATIAERLSKASK